MKAVFVQCILLGLISSALTLEIPQSLSNQLHNVCLLRRMCLLQVELIHNSQMERRSLGFYSGMKLTLHFYNQSCFHLFISPR
jgi:hypothetical protein